MTPLHMGEERAIALLTKWEPAGMEVLLEPAHMHRGELHHPAIQVFKLWTSHTKVPQACQKASKLRQYLEGLSLLSCCRGFDPEENPGFWRRYFVRHSSAVSHRITRGLLSSVEVTYWDMVDPETTAAAFASLLCSRRAVKIRGDLEKALEAYLERAPPPLQIKLSVHVYTDEIAVTVRRVLQRVDRIWAVSSTTGTIEAVQLKVGRKNRCGHSWINNERVKELQDIATISCVALREMHLFAERDSFGSPPSFQDLSALMRELVRRNTLRSMSWEFMEDFPRAIAVICSALPYLTALSSMSLVFEGGPRDGSCAEGTGCNFYEWLAYALMQRKIRGLSLSLEVDFTAGAKQAIEDACGRLNCLETLLSSSYFAPDTPIITPRGATATLVQGTIVDPLEDVDGLSCLMMHSPQRVDVVAQCGSKAVVVVPGVGLMTTRLSSLQAWHQAARPGQQLLAGRGRFLVDSLVCRALSCVDVLELFAPNLTHLTLLDGGLIDEESLDAIVSLCQKLTKFTVLSSELEALAPLLDAYTRRESSISTLIYDPRDCGLPPDDEDGGAVEQCVRAFAAPDHPISSIIKELHLYSCDFTIIPDLIFELAQAVRANKRLEFLHVIKDRALLDEEEENWLQELVDQPLLQNDRSRRALLTFLMAIKQNRVLPELPVACLKAVAQYAAVPVRRCVSWN